MQSNTSTGRAGRLDALDALRGVAIVMMVIFHFCFDLTYWRLAHFEMLSDWRWIGWRTLIVSLFLFLVGVSLVLGREVSERHFWRRWSLIAGSALLISLISWLMFGERFIYFGVLHFIALAQCLGRQGLRLGWLATCFGLAFVALLATVVVAAVLPSAGEASDMSGELNAWTTTTRDFVLVVVLLTPLQVWSAGWYQAGLTIGSLVLAVAVASLLTVTTRINDMLDSMVAGLQVLRPLGVDPDRVALLLALAIRSIPVIATALQQSQEARAARGLDRSLRALLTPTMNRTIRYAQGVGEALMARGLDD